MRTYTFGQCARFLNVDPKVFRRWVKVDLGLQEQEQVSQADRRVRYLTHEQVTRLAQLHGRLPPAEDILPEASESPASGPGGTKLLADRLEVVERANDATTQLVSTLQETLTRLDERVTQVERQAEQQAPEGALLDHLSAWLTDRETHAALPLSSGALGQAARPEPYLLELEAQHRQQLAELEARYQHQIADLQAQLTTAQRETPPPSSRLSSGKPSSKSKTRRLPKGLVSRSAFAALHHVPDSVVARACQTGKIAAVNGKWLYQSRIIFQALGERGQQDFYQLFHSRPDFILCHRCPHSESSHAVSSTSPRALSPRSTDE